VHDGALDALGPPARAAWLLTAFAILGDRLGLVPAQVELALARARVAATSAHTSLRHEAAAFRVDQDDLRVEALQPLLLRRTTAAVVAGQAGPAAAALRELLALFPEVVQHHAWLALELRAYEAVGARMQAGDEAAADALSATLADIAEAQFESVRQGAAGLRALRGAFFVWLAERRFGTERHAEAMHALDAAAAVYAKVPAVHDLPQAQIPRLRGEDARRQRHPERAVVHFVEALRYLTEKYTGPRGLIVATLRALSDVLFELGRHDESEAILHRTLELVRDRPHDTALHAAVRGTVAVDLARITLEHARADRRDTVRARVTELHGFLSGLPPLADDDAVALLRQLGLLHERLGEHAAARGCYALCLARIGPRQRAMDGFFVRAATLYANSLFNTGDFAGLEAFVRDTTAALRAHSPDDDFAAKWSQSAADLLDALERFAATTPPTAARSPPPGRSSALARQLRAAAPHADDTALSP
jgi:tetratricopeptide (TPR) repeat protein